MEKELILYLKMLIAEAVERGALRCFRNTGQSCNAPTRMLVEKSMYDEAVERVKNFANS